MMLRLIVAAGATIVLTACGSDTTVTMKTTPSTAPSPVESPAADGKLIDYGQDGVSLMKPADVDKLVGAPEDFKTFITGVVEKETAGSDPSDQCAPAVGVGLIDPRGFASGGFSACSGSAVIWAKQNGTWGELWGGQFPPDCSKMKAAGVPKAIVDDAIGQCFDKTKNEPIPYEP